MRRGILTGLVVLLTASGLFGAEGTAYRPGYILARFADVNGQPPSTTFKNNILKAFLGTSCDPVAKEYGIVPGLTLVQLPAGLSVENAKIALGRSPSILYAEPDYILQLCAVPNDTRFAQQWALRNTGQTGGLQDSDIDAVEAWDLRTGSSNVIVAVTDTGVDYNHPDLAANMWVNTAERNGQPGVDDDGNGYIDDVYGWDGGDNDGDPYDNTNFYGTGHGTHVAGTIGAVGNNGRGVAGVCWTVRIMAVKIADANGTLTLSGTLGGIDYARRMNARVMNASWAGYNYIQSLYDAIAAVRDAGVLFVAAASNEDNDNDLSPAYPASYNLDNIISVLATDDEDERSSYSNYGQTTVDVGAPGGDQSLGYTRGILSTVPNGQYDWYQGTSMASPHVAGAAALVLSAVQTLNYTDVKNILLATVDPLESLEGLCVKQGRLNVYKALQEALMDTMPPDPNPPVWDIAPKATGLATIAMEAGKVTDRSGVEYYFECVSDAAKSSTWQNGASYQAAGLSQGTPYGFRVKARDKSARHNETGWSTTLYATTASGADNLSPSPDPARWLIKPKLDSLSPLTIRMRAKAALDGCTPVQYYFDCTYVDPPGVDPDTFDSGWIAGDTYVFTHPQLLQGSTYTFVLRTRDNCGNETMPSEPAAVTLATSTSPRERRVPSQYYTIQAACNAANDGDVVVLAPGRYRWAPYIVLYSDGNYLGPGNANIIFSGTAPGGPAKKIIVRSTEPNNPAIVAATVIDGDGNDQGFRFIKGEGRDSVLEGVTIRNCVAREPDGNDGASYAGRAADGSPGAPGGAGGPGYDGAGGAIMCGTPAGVITPGTPSSPSLLNLVIENCVAAGGNGGNGGNGEDGGNVNEANSVGAGGPGGNGGRGGFGYGGAIFCSTGSHPLIDNCRIANSFASAGSAGSGGDGGDGGNGRIGTPPWPGASGGNGGNGGDAGGAFGGAIYAAPGSSPLIVGCTIESSTTSQAGTAGTFGAGGLGGTGSTGQVPPAQSGTAGKDADAQGGGIYAGLNSIGIDIIDCNISANISTNGANGGGVYLGPLTASLVARFQGCRIAGNSAGSTMLGSGGGVWYGRDSGTIIFEDCNITNNIGGLGGGICAGQVGSNRAVHVQINDSNVSGNRAFYGGGLLLNEVDLIADGLVLNDNNAIEGAGLSATGSRVAVRNSTVSQNGAMFGGGCFLLSSGIPSAIEGSVFTGNSADAFGGAVMMEGGNLLTSPVEITNCLFVDNDALYDGGALSCAIGAKAEVSNCTFIGNEVLDTWGGSGGAVSCREFYAQVKIENSILWDNTAAYGNEIAVGTPYGSDPYGLIADVDVNYCDVKGLDDGIFVEDWDYTAVWWWYGNIDADPCFASTDINQDTYYLSQLAAGQLVDSPCFDTGSGDASWLSTRLGRNVTTRTDHFADAALTDMGYHYDADTPVRMYELKIEVVDANGRLRAEGGGSDPFVILDPNTRFVNAGTVVRLKALPDLNYGVLRWRGTDNDRTADANNTVTMNEDKVVQVWFHNYTLTIAVEGDEFPVPGRLRASSADPVDPFTIVAEQSQVSRGVVPGTVVALQAEPNDGYRVRSWTGSDDDASIALTNAVTMDQTRTVEVAFEPTNKYYLTVRLNGSGSISADGQILPNPGRIEVAPGKVVNLFANRDNPSQVIIWQGTDNDDSPDPANKVTMNGHREVLVEYYSPKVLYVGGDSNYPTIQAAIDDAQDRDIVMLMPSTQPYYTSWGFVVVGKNITITSADPNNPAVVAATVITQQVGPGGNTTLAFQFQDVGPLMLLDGITIRSWSGYGGTGLNGDTSRGYYDGVPGGTVPSMGIVCYDNASPTIRNCVIDDCHALGGNGGDGAAGSVTAVGTLPPHPEGGNGGWPGGANGGGMSILTAEYFGLPAGFSRASNPTLINCTFSGCTAIGGVGGDGGNAAGQSGALGGRGGGWYYGSEWPGANWFWGIPRPGQMPSDYSGQGGAVYIYKGCSPRFVNCTFTNNRSAGGLNGICGQNDPGNSRNQPNMNYVIDNLGGAVYIAGESNAVFENCVFNDNLADTNKLPASNDGSVGFGGAVAFEEGATPTFINCQVNGNNADVGGGMYWSWCAPVIEDSDFTNNSAQQGGALVSVGGTAWVRRTAFIANDSNTDGGAMSLLGADAEIIDSNMSNNQAQGSGGAIYASSRDMDGNEVPGGNEVILKNSLIIGNTAQGGGGGGLATDWHAEPNITNCTIAYNTAATGRGGALLSGYGNYANIINSILWANTAGTGPQLALGKVGYPSHVKVTYSDIQGGAPGVDVLSGSTLEWDVDSANPAYPTNIRLDPRFVNGAARDFHLSQLVAGQAINSPCVDRGSATVSVLGLTQYTTRTDEQPDRMTVDMGYHYPVAEECRFCDIVRDGAINFHDLAAFAQRWLNTGCSGANAWCGRADLTFDGEVQYADLEVMTDCWLAMDKIAPSPDPAQWQVEPYSPSQTSIAMQAYTAVDTLWGLDVNYFFDCVMGDCHDSGWIAGPNYVDANLEPNAECAYRVKVRDIAGNETEWSVERYAIAGAGGGVPGDTTPPAPNPMTWATPPYATDSNTITMTATTATDLSEPVQYQFEETTGANGGTDSAWLSTPQYTDAGLDANTQYCYRARARDAANNVTGWSSTLCATPTDLNDNTPPTPAPTIVYNESTRNVPADNNSLSGQYMIPATGRWWHKVVADVSAVTDDSGGTIMIRFFCQDPSFNSPFVSMTAGVPVVDPSGKWRVTYDGGTIVYDVDVNKVGSVGVRLAWTVCAYDPSMNEACSAPYVIGPF